jgi:O-antigen/teichoic acid export membrane protein
MTAVLTAPAAVPTIARSSLVGFLGAAVSAVMGFALTVVLAHGFGQSGAGIVLQVVGVTAILLGFAKVGMDSVVVWLLPPLRVTSPSEVRGALTLALLVAAAAGAVAGLALAAVTPALAAGGAEGSGVLADALRAVAWFLPAGTVVLVALAATRALGGMWAYTGIGGIGLPTARVLAAGAVALAGGSAVGAVIGWAALLLPAVAVALVVLTVQLRRSDSLTAPALPQRALAATMWRYAVPRTASAGLEQGLQWFDVLLVGVLVGASASGSYGAASRFLAAGLMVDTALRMVVAPRLSAAHARARTEEAGALYQVATSWLVLFSTPIYLTMALFAPVLLGWLGEGFVEAAPALTLLSGAALVTLCLGPVHTVLLMGGRSGWAAINKALALTCGVALNLILLPAMGILGAAISWAIVMLLDAVLAAVQVRRFLGIRLAVAPVLRALGYPVACVALGAAVAFPVFGQTAAGLACTVLLGGAALLACCAADARRLGLRSLGRRVSGSTIPDTSTSEPSTPDPIREDS